MRSRVALVCLVWGEHFAHFLARYCLPSLLEPHNIPLASRGHEVTLLLYTDQATREVLARCASIDALSKFAKVEYLPLGQFPPRARTNHWVPWQHAAAGRTRDFDCFLVIIPDCVYAAGSLGRILDALEQNDTVYYRLPQVCKETVTVDLDALRRVDGHEYIRFTPLQAVELFIRHINPKHAAAACSGTFLIDHPEYAIQLSPERMIVSEIVSHPLAVRSGTMSLSYTFSPLSAGARACYLEILGVSAEPAIKFLEQYYRWPKLHRDHSRLMNLGTWATHFCDASNDAYAKSATHVVLDGGRALEQRQGEVTRARTRFFNTTLTALAIGAELYLRAHDFADKTAAKYVALVMAAPGFRRRLRSLENGFTAILPRAAGRFHDVVQRIEARPNAREILQRFLLLHVVPHPLRLPTRYALFLTYPDAADQLPKAFTIDPNALPPGDGLWGRATSQPRWVHDNAFCIEADIDYSHLTWSMIDTVNGTAERVLADTELAVGALNGAMTRLAAPVGDADSKVGGAGLNRALALPTGMHVAIIVARRAVGGVRNIAKFAMVRAADAAIKVPLLDQSAWLGRNLYRKARGRPWLSREQAGIGRPIALRRWAQRSDGCWRTAPSGTAGAGSYCSASPHLLPSEQARAKYDAIAKLNLISSLAKTTRAFYERLGMSPLQSPVYACLTSMRSQLAAEVSARSAVPPESALERFELAWHAFDGGNARRGYLLFREVIADTQLREACACDPRAREAVVRAAEIVGRLDEVRGDTKAAAECYRQVLALDGNGVVARRLLLMLWRDGRLREAAELAPRVVESNRNLAQYLRDSDAARYLTNWLGREARRELEARRGQDAGDI
jgi:tetratricopeptide (TPR) repeat protein